MTDDFRLLPSQAAEVAEVLQEGGFDPAEFAWTDAVSEQSLDTVVSRLTHITSGFYFQFDHGIRGHFAIFTPGTDQRLETDRTDVWTNQRETFEEWSHNLRREVETPNPWSQFLPAASVIREGEEHYAGNDAFTDAEFRDLVRRIEAIRAVLLERAGDPEARARIEAKLDHLVAQARFQSRRDWYFMAMGVLLSEVLSLALDPDRARRLFEILVRGVQQLTGG